MTKKQKLLVLVLYLGLLLLFFIFINFHIPCLIKSITGIPCPACGMTRSFILMLNFKFIESFSYNILAFPLAVILSVIFVVDIIDLIFKKDYLSKIINFFIKYYLIIILLLVISWVVNIYRGI